VLVIPKAANREHVKENARAASLTLTDEDVARLAEAFPLRRSRELPVL
jgi:diketogulonate reductase-like aldo/keto reductase